jgi:hypothetical protein
MHADGAVYSWPQPWMQSHNRSISRNSGGSACPLLLNRPPLVLPFLSPAVHAKALDCGQLSLDPCYGQPKVLSALQWIDKTMDKKVDKRRPKNN